MQPAQPTDFNHWRPIFREHTRVCLNGTGIRLVHTKAEVSGHITIEVEPSSRVNSQCGDLYEVMTVSSRTAAKKRWYCVLVENNLYLQTSPRDQNHKKVMPMKHAIIKYHKVAGALGVIEIRSMDGVIMLTSNHVSKALLLKQWYRKLRSSAAASLIATRRKAVPLDQTLR